MCYRFLGRSDPRKHYFLCRFLNTLKISLKDVVENPKITDMFYIKLDPVYLPCSNIRTYFI